jgi:hypothetical protein
MRYATLTVTTENSTYEFAIHAWDTFVSATRGGSVLASLGTRSMLNAGLMELMSLIQYGVPDCDGFVLDACDLFDVLVGKPFPFKVSAKGATYGMPAWVPVLTSPVIDVKFDYPAV